MSLIDSMCRQKAVYWPKTGTDDFGQPKLGAAQEVKCRWEDRAEKYINADGDEDTSSAVVYVRTEVKPGGMLWLGTLATCPDLNDGRKVPDAFEVKALSKIPNLKATKTLMTAYL